MTLMVPQGIYFDSALVAKFYLNEPGVEVVRALAATDGPVTTSALAMAEIAAAFHRKLREGAITRAMLGALDHQVKTDFEADAWKLVPVSESILVAVQNLFTDLDSRTYLRSADAVHLVTAMNAGFRSLYTTDRHLLAACEKFGIEGVNPL